MLITELKATETILSELSGKVFVINCHGCREIRFPEAEAEAFQRDLIAGGVATGVITTDYICNPENLKLRLEKHAAEIEAADMVLVFSCGVGVQTVAEMLGSKKVCAACDTYPLPGGQGVTPRPLIHRGQQRLCISIQFRLRGRGRGMKITIRTLGHAKRRMQI